MGFDERSLIEKAKNGEQKAFDHLTELYLEKAFSIAVRYTGSDADARDIVQETFYKVYANLRRYNPEYPFSAWFYRILINSSINFLKRKRRKQIIFQEGAPHLEASPVERSPDAEHNPEQRLIQKELQENLMRGLQSLPEKQRSAIILFDLEGFSQREVAEILRCPPGSVMSRLFYGRKKLRKFIEKYL